MGTHLFLFTQLLALLASSIAYAEGGCAQNSIGQVLCAPPGGGAQINSIGQVMCGPGQCVVNLIGQVYCSSQAAGSAAVNSIGQPVCVGGCVLGSASYCQSSSSDTSPLLRLEPESPSGLLPPDVKTLHISPEQWEEYKRNYDLQFPSSQQAIRDRELEEQHKHPETLPPGFVYDQIDINEHPSKPSVTKTRFVMVSVSLDHTIAAYADRSTIRKAGKKVKMWVLFDYKTAMPLSTGKPYLSFQEQREFDCKKEQLRGLYSTFYSENMRMGEAVGIIDTPSNWSPVSPESMDEALWKFACGKSK